MLNLLLSFLFLLGNSQKDTTTLGVTQTVYTDSLPLSPTCTYYVAGDITLQGNFDLSGVTFLLKSDFRRDYTLDKQTNKRIKQANGLVFGTNIRLCKARVNLDNCTFAAADSGMWGGVYLADSSSQLRLFQTNIEDSYNGIIQIDNSQIVADQSHFLNNYVSLQLAGNRDTVRYCSFSAKPKMMKMPFDSVAATDYYYSFAHIKNAANKELYLNEKCLVSNLFHQAIFGILANEKHSLQVQYSYFSENKCAAIAHQKGSLQLTDTNEIHLPQKLENTWQLRKALKDNYLTNEDSLRNPAFGIFSEGQCNDFVGENNSFISQNNVANGRQMKFNHIAYHGQNGINLDFRLGDVHSFPNFVYGMQTGIYLINHASAQINASTFVDNQTAIHVEKTSNGLIVFDMKCNSFVKTSTMKETQCIGLQVDGNGTMNNIGGCSDFSLSPAGNEVVNELGISAVTAIKDRLAIIPENFIFIKNTTSHIIEYFRYKNEGTCLVPCSGNVSISLCQYLAVSDNEENTKCLPRIEIIQGISKENLIKPQKNLHTPRRKNASL